jgi:hypothetical protein
MCSVTADTASKFVLPKIPETISACRTSRSRAALGRVTGEIASEVGACGALKFSPSSSGVKRARLTAHHDEVVAMHAADDARAVAVGLIM